VGLHGAMPAYVSAKGLGSRHSDAAGLFGSWGLQLVKLGFTPGDLFDVSRSGKQGRLVWAVQGSPVMVLGPGFVKLQDSTARRAPIHHATPKCRRARRTCSARQTAPAGVLMLRSLRLSDIPTIDHPTTPLGSAVSNREPPKNEIL
jgi:hypothetical protein